MERHKDDGAVTPASAADWWCWYQARSPPDGKPVAHADGWVGDGWHTRGRGHAALVSSTACCGHCLRGHLEGIRVFQPRNERQHLIQPPRVLLGTVRNGWPSGQLAHDDGTIPTGRDPRAATASLASPARRRPRAVDHDLCPGRKPPKRVGKRRHAHTKSPQTRTEDPQTEDRAGAAEPPGRARAALDTPQLVLELLGDAVADVGAALGLLRGRRGRAAESLPRRPPCFFIRADPYKVERPPGDVAC